MTVSGTAGTIVPLTLNWYNEENGLPDDPITIQLDITYGSVFGIIVDTSGPFTYQGLSTPSSAQIWRVGIGNYMINWQAPVGLETGDYVANWTVTYGSITDTFLVTENVFIQGATFPVLQGDVGFWSGSFAYQAAYMSSPLVIPFGQIDANGIAWAILEVKGWDGIPTVGGVLSKTADHGSLATSQFYGPRVVVINAFASAPTQALRDVARATMAQCVPVNDLMTFTYNEPVPKFVSCRLNGQAGIVETCPDLCSVEFQIPLVCPDPRKYSIQQQNLTMQVPNFVPAPLTIPFPIPLVLPSTVPPGIATGVATNNGSFETRPIITITGPCPAPVITNVTTGQVISFSEVTLGNADTLEIDTDNRIAFLNGAPVAADLSSAWWVLDPTTITISLSSATGDADIGATLVMTWFDAYN